MDKQIETVSDYLRSLQGRLCIVLEAEESRGAFQEDAWTKPEGGGGSSRVLRDGVMFEQAAVNFSHVHGSELPPAATARRAELAGRSWQALGISVVIHPRNPYVPTAHANLRLFVADGDDPIWWFGGGLDLTPYYPYLEDVVAWHRNARAACDRFGQELYPRFKSACDDYFYLKHRGECRGVGGIFFDDLSEWEFDTCFNFVRSVGEHFLTGYLPIVQRRHEQPYGERERQFQLFRRGRYVEFNLLQDRGTLFGLQSGGRTESILASLPPLAGWRYGWEPAEGTPEAALSNFLKPRDWLGESAP